MVDQRAVRTQETTTTPERGMTAATSAPSDRHAARPWPVVVTKGRTLATMDRYQGRWVASALKIRDGEPWTLLSIRSCRLAEYVVGYS